MEMAETVVGHFAIDRNAVNCVEFTQSNNSRWTGCLLDEVDWVPVTLKHFIEVGFFSLPCYGSATVSI